MSFRNGRPTRNCCASTSCWSCNGKTGAGVYIWPSVEAAQRAHNEEWRQSVIKRSGGAPTIRYFDLFLLIDNEQGKVTEFPAAAEIQPAAA